MSRTWGAPPTVVVIARGDDGSTLHHAVVELIGNGRQAIRLPPGTRVVLLEDAASVRRTRVDLARHRPRRNARPRPKSSWWTGLREWW